MRVEQVLISNFSFLIFTMFHKITDTLLSVIYPQACQICEKSVEMKADGVVCRACWEKTRVFSGAETLCHKCSFFLHGNPTDYETFCHQCDEHFYDAARAVGLYENALSASILHLKEEPFVSKNLQNLFITAFENSPFQDTNLIVPVPLSKRRFFERGFNQAGVLAQILAKNTHINLDEQSLVRIVHTPIHRAAMDRQAREKTVENAFDVKRQKLLEEKKILLVDDVFTSGATVSSCAKVLKQKGAAVVYVLTIARV